MSNEKPNPISKEALEKQLKDAITRTHELRGQIERATVEYQQLNGIVLYIESLIRTLTPQIEQKVVESEVK